MSSTLVECGFEQCLVAPCVFRPMVNDGVVAMSVVQVDDIKIAVTKGITDSVVQISTRDSLRNILARLRGTWVASARGIVRRDFWRFHRLNSFEMLSNVSV